MNISARNLGGVGIVSDINSYDLPPNAVSAGVNVRFENGTISRSPVMRRVYEFAGTYASFTPSYMFSIPPLAAGAEALINVAADYTKIYSVTGVTIADLTPAGILGTGATDQPYTHTFLGNVAYLNRSTTIPLVKRQADATFISLPNWGASDRCKAMRSYKDFLVALNVTKAGVDYPTMVKWSDITPFGSYPPSWTSTTTNSAGENVLNEMRGPLLDGRSLRDTFFLYGQNEVWVMSYVGGDFIFDFRKRFESVGVINTNCVVEVDGFHYVFDKNDIYKHDGSTKDSIIHGKNKDFLFQSLKKDLAYLCFTHHDPKLNEIRFCYASGDRLVGFNNPTTGCNRAAVYNYRRDTWSFDDAPNVVAATSASIATGQTYDSVGTTVYQSIGGTYLGDGDQAERHSLFLSRSDALQGITFNRILGLDLLTGGRLSRPIEPEALKDAFIERVGIDLDEKGFSLASFKSFLGFYPQLSIRGGATQVKYQFGASTFTGAEPVWNTPQTFDPVTQNKLDVRVAGRYLSYRLYHSGITDFRFSGYDMRLTKRGKQ